jgi:hypothetical protein
VVTTACSWTADCWITKSAVTVCPAATVTVFVAGA